MPNPSNFLASVTLEDDLDHRYEFTGKVAVDVRDFLGLTPAAMRDLMRDFDGGAAPYLSRLPGPDAAALDQIHSGRNRCAVSFLDFLDDLGVVPDDADGDAWLDDALMEAARTAAGYHQDPAPSPTRIFKIAKRWVAARLVAGTWQPAGSFSDERSALAAMAKHAG